MTSFEQLAQSAYEAYIKDGIAQIRQANREDRPLSLYFAQDMNTSWVDLSDQRKACWVAAAKQMVAEISALH